MDKQTILDAYNAKGLVVDKINRTKLDDGYFVYHPYGNEHKGYKRSLVKEDANEKTYLREKFPIRCDWIEDNNDFMLRMSISEAIQRRG